MKDDGTIVLDAMEVKTGRVWFGCTVRTCDDIRMKSFDLMVTGNTLLVVAAVRIVAAGVLRDEPIAWFDLPPPENKAGVVVFVAPLATTIFLLSGLNEMLAVLLLDNLLSVMKAVLAIIAAALELTTVGLARIVFLPTLLLLVLPLPTSSDALIGDKTAE